MVGDLRTRAGKRKLVEIWTDEEKLFHHPSFSVFREKAKGSQITGVKRRGKIIVMELKPSAFLLFHPKMTGHFLILGPAASGRDYLGDRSIHLVFLLDNGYHLGWSDQRKFSRIEYWPTDDPNGIPWLAGLGREPLADDFGFSDFRKLMVRGPSRIKSWLMDQRFIAGIGNIYASEILWRAKIDPERSIKELSVGEQRRIFIAMKEILRQAVADRGTSVAEFRDIEDRPGNYAVRLKTYRKNGRPCRRCQEPIRRKMTGGRSTYYCLLCQS